MDSNIAYFEQILSNFDAIHHTAFNPQTLKHEIIIYGPVLFLDRFADKLYLEIRKQAPLAKISIRQWNLEARSRFIGGENSVLFDTYDESLPQVIMQKHICNIYPIFFVREGHPAQTFEDLKKYPLVMTRNPGWSNARYPLLDRLSTIGHHIVCHGEIENTLAIENLIRTSDNFSATMSQQLPNGCREITLPTLSDSKLKLVMSYHRAKQNDPQKKWLFELSEQLINQV